VYLIDRQLSDGDSFTHFHLGEPAAPPTAPAPPAGLKLLDHVQAPKRRTTGVPAAFITDPIATMATRDLNPGFIDPNDNLIVDTSSDGLQTCLGKLITTQFQNYLGNRSSTAPSGNDRLRVALVDLTGDKLVRPDFAGWGSTVSMYGASVPKILAVYAAHQLRMDLRYIAATQKISTGLALEKAALQQWSLQGGRPDLGWLFDIRRWSGPPSMLNFSTAASRALAGIMHNEDAGSVIVGVGFPYIASVTWQSGLFHPTRGGLWLTGAYGKGSWIGNPLRGVNSANVTALSAATYLTLLAQGRLVDDATSKDIITVLQGGCLTSLFPDPRRLGVVASKCGIYSGFLHDCALIVRRDIRYVVAGLTITNANETGKYSQLFLELDNLIVRNNQTPKAGC
jgi:hypothetical protein